MNYEAFIDSFAGASGALLGQLLLYPFENFRTRLQANKISADQTKKEAQKSTLDFLKDLIDKDGILSLYRGLKVALIATIVSYGVYFWWYRFLKNKLAFHLGHNNFSQGQMIILTAIAGILSSAISNPIWMVNTRLSTQKNDG